MNLYGYASGDPINLRDPFGLGAETSDPGDLAIIVKQLADQAKVSPDSVMTMLKSATGMTFNEGENVSMPGLAVTAQANNSVRLSADGGTLTGTGFSVQSSVANARDVSVTVAFNGVGENTTATVSGRLRFGALNVNASFAPGLVMTSCKMKVSVAPTMNCPK